MFDKVPCNSCWLAYCRAGKTHTRHTPCGFRLCPSNSNSLC